jgi:HEAT repeat protein
VLQGDDPALSVIAAWALGRMRDSHALEPLRAALDSRYRSVRAHAARSLAGLDDAEAVPLLEARLRAENDPGLRVVYAASLAKLNDENVIPDLVDLMRSATSEIARKEMALALARLIGNESAYIQLLRQVDQDPGTTLSKNLAATRKRLSSLGVQVEDLSLADECAGDFARGDLDRGVMELAALASKLSPKYAGEPFQPVLETCILGMKSERSNQLEYPVLLLHLLRESL